MCVWNRARVRNAFKVRFHVSLLGLVSDVLLNKIYLCALNVDVSIWRNWRKGLNDFESNWFAC